MAQTLSTIDLQYTASTSEDIILAYAVRYGIAGEQFLETAECESGLRADAISPHDGVGGSRGVFQFQTATFNRYKAAAGLPHGNVWDPFDNIQVAAYMWSIGQSHQWTCARELGLAGGTSG